MPNSYLEWKNVSSLILACCKEMGQATAQFKKEIMPMIH